MSPRQVTKLRQCSVLRSISCRTTSRSRTGAASYNVVEYRRISQNIAAWCPRGGIELSPIGLKLRHFSNDDFPAYPLMYPAFRTIWQRRKPFVYVRCAHFNGQSLAQAMFRELDRCPPKACVKSGDVAVRFERRPKFNGLRLDVSPFILRRNSRKHCVSDKHP